MDSKNINELSQRDKFNRIFECFGDLKQGTSCMLSDGTECNLVVDDSSVKDVFKIDEIDYLLYYENTPNALVDVEMLGIYTPDGDMFYLTRYTHSLYETNPSHDNFTKNYIDENDKDYSIQIDVLDTDEKYKPAIEDLGKLFGEFERTHSLLPENNIGFAGFDDFTKAM